MYSFIHPPFITCFIFFIHFISFFLFHLSTPSYFIFIQLRTTDQQVPFFFFTVHSSAFFYLFVRSRTFYQLFFFIYSFTVHSSAIFVSFIHGPFVCLFRFIVHLAAVSFVVLRFLHLFIFFHLSIDLEYHCLFIIC